MNVFEVYNNISNQWQIVYMCVYIRDVKNNMLISEIFCLTV